MTEHQRPIINTYWVEPYRLLAGEYPGAPNVADAKRRLNCFLNQGVNVFIDLTAEDELAPYSELLEKLAAVRKTKIIYLRYPIPDKGVPANLELMRSILHTIRLALNDGKTVYVHCWGGIGRTGTIIACYLAEQHNSSKIALNLLSALWQQMEKRDRYPRSPETSEQVAWIHEWSLALKRIAKSDL